MSEFFFKIDSKNLTQQKTCFKSTNNLSCIDLFVTNSPSSFQNTITFASSLSDFHEMILTILKSTFPKVRPKQLVYRKFKNFDLNNFKNEIRTKMQPIEKYETFQEEFLKVLNKHASLKKKFIRINYVPYMTKNLCKAIMKDYYYGKYAILGVIMVNKNVLFESRFSFTAVNEDDIQRETLNLNAKKSSTFGNIPTKMLKRSSEIGNVVLQNISNSKY